MLNATPLLKLYAKYRLGQLEVQKAPIVQELQLKKLLRRAAHTRFGRDHGFSKISTVEEFQQQVPLRTYEQLWNDYWKSSFPVMDDISWPGRIPFYALSSGTTSGTTKYLPLTPELRASNNKAGMDMMCFHLKSRPRSKVLGGNAFILGGSTDLIEQVPGVFSGDLSGIVIKTMPWWARLRTFPTAQAALVKNWEEKIDSLARSSLQKDIRSLHGVPSWMLILFEKLKVLRPDTGGNAHGYYPNLELIVHGGVKFGPYHKIFSELLAGGHAETREVYPASEGFIAAQDRSYNEGLRMMLDHGIFYEFVPLEELGSKQPTRHWIKTIEREINYAVVLSSCAGLWSYILGDTVKFVETDPPRLLVTGRTSYYLSAFGEHLIAEELDDSLVEALLPAQLSVCDYSVGALFPQNPGELGGHLWVIEFSGRVPNESEVAALSTRLDQGLCRRNEDYEGHRAKGFGLNPPRFLVACTGAFNAWMKGRGKLGGQHKVPRIITDQALFQNLVEFIQTYNGRS